MLGGCSSINAQMAQYGAPGDFDEWASLTGDDSWSWKKLQRYFTKFEKYTHDTAYPEVDLSERGSTGPVRIGYFTRVSEHSKAFLKACAQVGIPLVADFNGSKGPIGASRVCDFAIVVCLSSDSTLCLPR
jgi:choline dehydrogenase